MENDLTERIVTAAEAGDIQAVTTALDLGASPDAMGPNSGALHVAAFGGHAEVVQLLLSRGANPNLQDKQSFYPLQLAVSKNHVETARLLIGGGANLEKATKYGGTALQVAAASGFAESVELLLQSGAKIESLDQGGNTPLLTALSLGNVEIAKQLLAAGANLSATTDAGESALLTLLRGLKRMQVRKGVFTGESSGQTAIFSFSHGLLTVNTGGVTRTFNWEEARKIPTRAIDLDRHLKYIAACGYFLELLGASPDPHKPDQDGHDTLSLACHLGEPVLIQAVAQAGGKIGSSNKIGVTGLHLVAGSGRLDGLEAVTSLFPNQDFNQQDQFGWTPLHYLADIGGAKEMAHLLLALGAEKDFRSTQERGNLPAGVTPKDVALHWKDEGMAGLL